MDCNGAMHEFGTSRPEGSRCQCGRMVVTADDIVTDGEMTPEEIERALEVGPPDFLLGAAFDAENGAGASDELLRLAEENTLPGFPTCPFCGGELCAVVLADDVGGGPGVSCGGCGAYTSRLPWREPWLYEGTGIPAVQDCWCGARDRQCSEPSFCGAAPPVATPERFRQTLAHHALVEVRCDHKTSRDMPVCNCAVWAGGWHPSVQAAKEAWASHVWDALRGTL